MKYIYLSIITIMLVSCGENVSSSTSKAGSLSRFAISGDYLYTINTRQMNIFDISDAKNPVATSKINMPMDIETLFPYKNYLYVGSNTGMYIYNNDVKTQPTFVTKFNHAYSCNPVIVYEDVAYVTLNTNENCNIFRSNDTNALEIIDVKNPLDIKLIKRVDMWSPTGLSIDNNKLFICDGSNGLKTFDINKTDINSSINISLTSQGTYPDINCYDIIANNNNLIISNKTNILQYNYNSFPMLELGKIK